MCTPLLWEYLLGKEPDGCGLLPLMACVKIKMRCCHVWDDAWFYLNAATKQLCGVLQERRAHYSDVCPQNIV